MSDPSWFHDEEMLLETVRASQNLDSSISIPGYDDLSEIARGGQGVVYKGRQSSTDRNVAIKVMFQDKTRHAKRKIRFERELEFAGLLSHPNIVRLYDGGALDNGALFAVMEFVDGIRLDEFVHQQALSAKQIVQLFLTICDAIAYAHRNGVIHRDLKPGNIIVSRDGQPHVLDFGIARQVGYDEQNSTRTGEFLGTLAYASPEQVSGKPASIDTRTDVYSLGVMLYELLTDQLPSSMSGSIGDIVQSIATADPELPSKVSSKSDHELDTIVIKTLEKDPEMRYGSVESLAADLRRYLNGQALEAKRHSKWYVLKKTVRRNRVKFASAFALLLTLLTFTVTVTLLWQQAVSEQREAKDIRVFWEDTLASASPSREDAELTFHEVLDEAVHWVELTATDQPQVEASLRTTIGNGYRNIGLFEKAETQLQRSLAIRQQHFGSDHIEVIQSLNAIGLLRSSQGKWKEALRQFNTTLQAREAQLGKSHPDVAMSLQNLGRTLMKTEDYRGAKKSFNRALDIRKQHFPADDPAIATVYFNLGELAMQQGAWVDAEKHHVKAFEIREKKLHPTHPDMARSMMAISRAKYENGKIKLAMQFAENALAVRHKIFPTDHMQIKEVERWLQFIQQQLDSRL